MKRRMIRLVAAFLATICLFLSGCAVTDAPEKPTEKEALVIGSDIYSPYFYLDDNGDFAGIDVEIAREACRRLGVTPEFKQISWQNKDACLKSGTVDCLWGSFSMNGREDDYNIGLNINKSAEITQNGTRKKHFIACREHIRCLWGRLFAKIVLYFSWEAHKTGSNGNRKIYRYPSERERLDAGEARRKARCDQQDHFPLGERQLYCRC